MEIWGDVFYGWSLMGTEYLVHFCHNRIQRWDFVGDFLTHDRLSDLSCKYRFDYVSKHFQMKAKRNIFGSFQEKKTLRDGEQNKL